MRRLFVIIACLSICCSLVIPTYAAEGDIYFAPLQFESVLSSGSSYPWVFNSTQYFSDSGYIFDLEDGMFQGSIDYVQADIGIAPAGGSFKIAGTDLSLLAPEPQFIRTSLLSNYSIHPLPAVGAGDIVIDSYSVSFYVYEPSSVVSDLNIYGHEWNMTFTALSKSFFPESGSIDADIGSAIVSMLQAQDAPTHEFYLVGNLRVDINFSRSSVDTPGFGVDIDYSLQEPYYATNWFNERHLATGNYISNQEFNFDWLKNAGESFLDFQIAPGLSFNGLLEVIVIVLIVLWFIKIIR